MTDFPAHSERLNDLLSDRALAGLSAAESAELDRLLWACKAGESFERAAAAAAVAMIGPGTEKMPEHLLRAIESQAMKTIGGAGSGAGEAAGAATASEGRDPGAPIPFPAPARAGAGRAGLAWLAAAAALMLGAIGWWPRIIQMTRPPAREPTLAELREQLIAADPKVVQAAWVMPAPQTPDPACTGGCAGDVVWSNELQQGYIRFTGLAVNDPSVNQYQLWIFDKNQSDAAPIDGGVFDITSAGEVIIPIDAKLKVVEPFMFAVTVEKPGGVVVTDRKRLPVLAKVG